MAIIYNKTRNQLAALVIGEMGALGSGESAGAADQQIVFDAVDMRLKELHKDGIIWRQVVNVPMSFSLSADTASASATADILFPISMTVLDGSMDEPVDIIGPREYAAIRDKTQSGTPTKALWKGGTEFRFWPVPDAATTAKLLYEKIADDTSASATMDVDVAMLRSLKNMVRFDVADHWGKAEATIMRWERQAKEAEKNVRKLTAKRVTYKDVAVDDFDNRSPAARRDSDYGF